MNQLFQETELISVIVPVYNIESYLPYCLDALSSQTYKNLEIILVDDASTDNSGKICEDYAIQEFRARVIHHEKNLGLWAARNTGQEASHGAYLWFPDGDDYFHRDILSILYRVINQSNKGMKYQLALCGCKETNIFTEDTQSSLDVSTVVYSRDELVYGLFADRGTSSCFCAIPNVWNKLYRRDLIMALRARPFARAQDLDFNFRVFQQITEAVVVTNPMYYWIIRNNSLMRTKDARILYPACLSGILFSLYSDFPMSSQAYTPFLLDKLYSKMVFWRGRTYGTEQQTESLTQSRLYARTTQKAYLRCKQIPLFKRLACIFLFHAPYLTRFLLKLTHNY